MIKQDEWDKLKANEQYAMYASLDRRLTEVAKRLRALEKDVPWSDNRYTPLEVEHGIFK